MDNVDTENENTSEEVSNTGGDGCASGTNVAECFN